MYCNKQNTSPDQNPAELTQLQAAFAYQNELIKDFQGHLSSLRAANEHLMCYIQSLPPTRPDPVRISLPDKFDGSAERCRGFLRQCTIYFDNQPEAFRRDSAKCSFMMSLLTGKALEWASAVWDQDDCLRTSFDYFSKQICEVFEYPAGGRAVSLQLLQLRQGNRTAADYAIEFRTLAYPCIPPINIIAINNQPIGGGITHQTAPVTVKIGIFHSETISLYVTSTPQHPIVLGNPWLAIHDPQISWNSKELTKW